MAYPNDQAQAGGAIPVWLAAAPSGSTSGMGTNRSGTITTGGTAQQLMAASTTRSTWFVSNPDPTNDLWIALNGVTAAVNGTGSVRVPANGGGFGLDLPKPVRGAISIIGAVTGQKFTAWES